MQTKKLPIGYWIKQADQLLTKGIDEIQSLFGVTRTDWQILNSIHENDLLKKAELNKLMAPFVDAIIVADIVTKFKNEHVINELDQMLTLTDKGRELYSACFEKQKNFRQQAMSGIAEQDYQHTILTLQKIIENIATAEV